MTLKELTTRFIELKDRKDEINDELKDINKKLKSLEERMIDEILVMEQQSAKFPGLATIGVTINKYPHVADKPKFFQYLKDTNQDGMVKQTVNHNTLRSWFKTAVIDVEAETIGLEVHEEPKIYYRRLK